MTALHHLATASPYIAALVVLLVIVSIGVLIWACLPERDRNSDIERQIATLRHKADHSVQTRPRVRAHSTRAPSMPPRSCGNANSKASPPLKPCGGGLCRHQADCSDTYCPGRLTASLLGGHRHARH